MGKLSILPTDDLSAHRQEGISAGCYKPLRTTEAISDTITHHQPIRVIYQRTQGTACLPQCSKLGLQVWLFVTEDDHFAGLLLMLGMDSLLCYGWIGGGATICYGSQP